MKTLAFLLLGLAAAGAQAADKPKAREPLPFAQCMRIDRINGWHIVDARTATVSNGPKFFRINLQASCPRLGLGPAGLIFDANESHKSLGNSRICGEVGETVSSSRQPPCAINSVQPISKAEYQRLNKRDSRRGSGANQPTRIP